MKTKYAPGNARVTRVASLHGMAAVRPFPPSGPPSHGPRRGASATSGVALPSISFVDAAERACCTRPVIDLASVEHERDRPTGGGDRGGAGAAAAAAARDAAQEVGAFGGADAERRQRQPDGSGGGAAAAGRAHRHALPMDRAPAGRPAAGR